MNPPPQPLAIVGPTASGKTTLSIDVARRLHGEIISMDSRQIYRDMDIGTAKATPAERAAVPHHGLDLINPGERFSAGRFARLARECIRQIQARDHRPILVGGTGFYLRALTDPIFRQPDLDPQRRAALSTYLEDLDGVTLKAWLAELDPPTAARLSEGGGRQRLLRALELPLLTGKPLSWWQAHGRPEAPSIEPLIFVLDLPRAELYQRINKRVTRMLDSGLLEEVRRLLESGYDPEDPGMNATGYVELVPHVRGEIALEDAAEQIRVATRGYARRQLTWFRHQLPSAIWLDGTLPRDQLVETIASTAEADSSRES